MKPSNEAGILAAILGNIAMNVAFNIKNQAKKRLVRTALDGGNLSTIDYSKWAGILMLMWGETTNLIAYGIAPASIISPLSVFTVISNCIIPPLLYSKYPNQQTILGTALALPGTFLLIWSSADTQDPGYFELLSPITRNYVISILALAIGVGIAKANVDRCTVWCLRIDALLGGVVGSVMVLCVKAISFTLSSKKDHDSPFIPYLAVAVVSSAALQFYIMSVSLKQYEIWHIVPYHFAFFVLFVSIGSFVLFHEFRFASAMQQLKFVIGLILAVNGVFIVAKPRSFRSICRTSVKTWTQRSRRPFRPYRKRKPKRPTSPIRDRENPRDSDSKDSTDSNDNLRNNSKTNSNNQRNRRGPKRPSTPRSSNPMSDLDEARVQRYLNLARSEGGV